MAAIGKSRFLTDIIKIEIGKYKKFFRFVKPHPLYILLAAHAILLAEFFGKAGIAQTALLCNVRCAKIFGQKKIDIFGYVFYYLI